MERRNNFLGRSIVSRINKNKPMQSLNFVESKHGTISFIDNFYTSTELLQIENELRSLHEVAKLGLYTNRFVSLNKNKKPNQSSLSLFLDDIYVNKREMSKILKLNRKIFNNSFTEELIKKNVFYTHLKYCNLDSTLINFYKQDDYYTEHRDTSCFTAITFFELEKFNGGELCFPEYSLTVEAVNNRVVIFPGFMSHAVKKVIQGVRVSMSQFINYSA